MRYKTLDSWRGICALLVVLYHANGTGWLGGSAFVRGAYLFVDFFFVLSGFVMCEAYLARIGTRQAFGTFLLRRLGRVWPLHAAMLLAFLSLEVVKLLLVQRTGLALNNAPFTGTLAPGGFLPSLLMLHSMGLLDGLTWNIPSWSIAAEFWTYVVFGLVVWKVRRRAVPLAAAIVVLSATVLALRSTNGMDATYDLGFVRCLYGFFLGVIVHQLSQRWRGERQPFGTSVEVATMAGVVTFVALAHASAAAFVSPAVFAITIFVFAWSKGGVSRVLQTGGFVRLGTWSYSIYMTHVFLLGLVSMGAKVVDRLVAARGATAAWAALWQLPGVSDLAVLAFTGVVVLVSAVTYRLIEVPGQSIANGWITGRLGRPDAKAEVGRERPESPGGARGGTAAERS